MTEQEYRVFESELAKLLNKYNVEEVVMSVRQGNSIHATCGHLGKDKPSQEFEILHNLHKEAYMQHPGKFKIQSHYRFPKK